MEENTATEKRVRSIISQLRKSKLVKFLSSSSSSSSSKESSPSSQHRGQQQHEAPTETERNSFDENPYVDWSVYCPRNEKPSPPSDLVAALDQQHTLPPNPPSDDEEEEEVKNTRLYVSVRFAHGVSWAMLYPYPNNNNTKLVFSHDYDFPQHLKYYRSYVFAVCRSYLFLVGGKTSLSYRGFPNFSDRMYMYNATTKTWNLLSPRLNVARSGPQVAVAGNIIYLFGGHSDVQLCADNWIEYYRLGDETWNLLPTEMHPDMFLCRDYSVHDERRHEVLFFPWHNGYCSFNYADRTWKFVKAFIGPSNHFCYHKVAIIHNIMFCPHKGIIYLYDLRKKKVVHKHTFQRGDCIGPSYLFRVGKEKLLIVYRDAMVNDETEEWEALLKCHTFRVKYSSMRYHSLVEEAHQTFVSPLSGYTRDFLLI